MKNTLEANKVQKEYPGLTESNMNSTYWTSPLPELSDIQKVFQMPDDIFDESYSSDTKSPAFSDKCCCEKLLDNYLCNKKCIWHGMPP